MKCVVVALSLIASLAAAQEPYLVKDLQTTGAASTSSYPSQFTVAGSSLYFIASDRENYGLWRSDGTAAGTTFVGSMSGRLAAIGDRLVGTDYSVWVSDGTPAGTSFVSGLSPVRESPLIEFNGKIAFLANSKKLYASDGTAAGTSFLQDLPDSSRLLARFGDGLAFVGSYYGLGITDGTPQGLRPVSSDVKAVDGATVAGNRLFFRGGASSYYTPQDLWVSDGTSAGTRQLKPSSTTYFSVSYDSGFVPVAGGVLFIAYDDSRAYNPWFSDGTVAGTQRLAQLPPNSTLNPTRRLAKLNDLVYFVAEDGQGGVALWRSDGTPQGTKSIVSFQKTIADLSAAGGKLWLAVGYPDQTLWVSDGTAGGTRPLADARYLTTPRTAFGNRVVFAGYDPEHGSEPWSSDGTPQGTSMIVDLYPNLAPASSPDIRGAAGRGIVFTAYDDTLSRRTYASDGTAEGTLPIPAVVSYGIRYHDLFYFADDKTTIWATDGTAAGTRKVLDFPQGRSLSFAVGGDVLYMTVGDKIYAVDGAGDPRVIAAGAFSSQNVDALGDLVYANGSFLWAITGTSAPRPLLSFTSSSYYSTLFTAGGAVCAFVSGASGTELWCTDGSAQGLAKMFSVAGYPRPALLGAVDDRFVFAIDDGVHGNEPWITDGTTAGTKLLADVNRGPASSTPGRGVSLGNRVVFLADDGVFGSELWVTDGTTAGTHMIVDLVPLKGSPAISELVAMKDQVWIVANDGLHGRELWRTDGTAAGTELFDLQPGPLSSFPSGLRAAGDALFFAAETIADGRELWAVAAPGRTIALGDGHAGESAAAGTMLVTLDRPSSERVTAQWRVIGEAGGGAIAFEPGETRKAIAVPIAPGRGARMIHVQLENIRGAIAARRSANLAVQADPGLADLALKLGWRTDYRATPAVLVTSAGPAATPFAFLTYSQVYAGSTSTYTPPVPLLMGTLRPGEAASNSSIPSSGLVAVNVTGPLADPDPSNNTITFRATTSSQMGLVVSPAAITTGKHATLSVASLTTGTAVRLESSNPAVVAVPESVIPPVDLDLTGLSVGSATITATGASGTVTLPITVAPPGPYRWPIDVQFTIGDSPGYYGAPLPAMLRVLGVSVDPAAPKPTGNATFFDGDRAIAVAPLDGSGFARADLKDLMPGSHTVTATYAGDENFFPSVSATSKTVLIGGPLAVTFTASARVLSETEEEITVYVHAPAGAPSGTVTLKTWQATLARNLPLIGGQASATIPRLPYVTVEYSGDDLFAPVAVVVWPRMPHGHAAR